MLLTLERAPTPKTFAKLVPVEGQQVLQCFGTDLTNMPLWFAILKDVTEKDSPTEWPDESGPLVTADGVWCEPASSVRIATGNRSGT
ncbi:MAG: hypothetical protein R3C28_19370 [Pirellulaceae bacterium]